MDDFTKSQSAIDKDRGWFVTEYTLGGKATEVEDIDYVADAFDYWDISEVVVRSAKNRQPSIK